MGVAIGIAWWWVAKKENVQPAPRMPMADRLKVTLRSGFATALPLIIIGGMKAGVFTPTEAAVVAAVYAFLVGKFVYRELKWAEIYGLFLAAGKTTAVVMLLVAAAMVSAWLIKVATIPTEVAKLMSPFMDNKTLLMFVMMALIVVVGTALDFAPTVLILTPVLMPLEEAGVVNLADWENGFRNLTNSQRPVAKVEDFDGVKLRVMQKNIFLDTFKTLGANAVPMAFGEVFTALETRTIDGQENPFVTINTTKFYEVQRYLSVTRHAYTPFLVLYSKKMWDGLSKDEQAVLREAAIEGQKVQRATHRAQESKALAELRARGT